MGSIIKGFVAVIVAGFIDVSIREFDDRVEFLAASLTCSMRVALEIFRGSLGGVPGIRPFCRLETDW